MPRPFVDKTERSETLQRFRKFREIKKLSHKDIAQAIGINHFLVSRIENDRGGFFSVQSLAQLLVKCHLNINWLLTGVGEMSLTQEEIDVLEKGKGEYGEARRRRAGEYYDPTPSGRPLEIGRPGEKCTRINIDGDGFSIRINVESTSERADSSGAVFHSVHQRRTPNRERDEAQASNTAPGGAEDAGSTPVLGDVETEVDEVSAEVPAGKPEEDRGAGKRKRAVRLQKNNNSNSENGDSPEGNP